MWVGVKGLSAPSAPLRFNLPFSVPLRFNLSLPLIGDYRLLTRDYRLKIARRWHSRSHPPKSCQFSTALPHIRRHKMSIQRSHGSVPPAISADKLSNLQFLQYLPHFANERSRLRLVRYLFMETEPLISELLIYESKFPT